jgi:stage V sporulation protein K
MSILRSMVTPGQRRGWMQKAVGLAAVAVGGPFAVKLAAALPPGIGLLAIAGIVSAVIVVLTRFNPAETAGPSQRNVQLVTAATTGGVAWTVLTACSALSHGLDPVSRPVLVMLTVLAVSMIATTAWARLKQTHPTALPVTIGDAVDAVSDSGRVRAACLGVGLVSVAASLAYAGVKWAPALVLLALIPVKLGWTAARARGNTRALISRKYCAAFTGDEWTQVLRAAKQSPVTCIWTTDNSWPDQILIPVPMGYDGATLENDKRRLLSMLTSDGSVHGDYRVRPDLDHQRLIVETGLPKLAPYPGYQGHAWNEIPIGLSEDGGVTTMRLSDAPHTLVAGTTGSGKSVLQRAQLAHVLMHRAKWRIIGVDLKRVELNWLTKYPNVLTIATELEPAVDAVRTVRDEMMRRYEEMELAGVNHFESLSEPPPALLLMVDETYAFLAFEKSKTDEGKARDELHSEARVVLGEIARLGRAAGVFEILSTQRPDADVLAGECKANLDNRVAAGRMDGTPSNMVLDSPAAQQLPRIKGRGIIRHGGELERFQGYFAELGPDLDRMIEEGAAVIASGKWSPTPVVPANSAPAPTAPHQPSAPASTTPGTGLAWSAANKAFKRTNPFPAGQARKELASLIGLASVKREVAELEAEVSLSLTLAAGAVVVVGHLVFTGNPGTCKTTAARILGSLLHDIGALSSGHVIEVLASDLVAEHVGGTGPAVVEAMKQAVGGVLFVDEAYALADMGGQFGMEAINALVAEAENQRETTVVVLAGYSTDMGRLLKANTGLRSRFPRTIHFPDYDTPELASIARSMVGDRQRLLASDADVALPGVLATYRDAVTDGWGNGRSARVLVDAVVRAHAVRVHGQPGLTDADLRTLTAVDVEAGLARAIEDADGSPTTETPELTVMTPPVTDGIQDALEAEVLEGEIVDDEGGGDGDFDWMDDAAVNDLVAGLITTDASTVKA